MDVKLWWQRFAIYVKSNALDTCNLKDILCAFLDDHCLQVVNYNVGDVIGSLDELKVEMFRLYKGDQDANNLKARFYCRLQQL